MQHLRKHSPIRRRFATVSIVACGLIVLVASPAVLHQNVRSDAARSTAHTLTPQQKMPASVPLTISIPAISVDAIVAQAGIKADGTMDIQKNPDQVAWYQFGTRPGDEGSAVIAGHSGWAGLHEAVFNKLYLLKKGDQVSVTGQDGTTNSFVVTGTKEYAPTASTADIFQSYDGKAHLNLITCDGVWVNATQSDSSRLVVFTDLLRAGTSK